MSKRSRRRRRAELHARDLRPVEVSVADTRSREFNAALLEQIARVNAVDEAEGIMDWLEEVSLLDEEMSASQSKGYASSQ